MIKMLMPMIEVKSVLYIPALLLIESLKVRICKSSELAIIAFNCCVISDSLESHSVERSTSELILQLSGSIV